MLREVQAEHKAHANNAHTWNVDCESCDPALAFASA